MLHLVVKLGIATMSMILGSAFRIEISVSQDPDEGPHLEGAIEGEQRLLLNPFLSYIYVV